VADAVALLVAASIALLAALWRGVVPLLATLATLQALAPGYRFQPALTAAETFPPTPTLEFLQRQARQDPDLRVFVPQVDVLPGNSLLVYGVPQALGVDGLDPFDYLVLVRSLPHPLDIARGLWTAENLRLERPLFDLLAARLVVVEQGAKLPEHFRIVHESGHPGAGVVVAENPRAAPRVYLTANSYVMQQDALQILARPPQQHVGLDLDDQPALAGPPMQHGEARIIERHGEQLRIETQADGAAFLVVLDGNLRGWRAEVDGVAAKIYRAFGAFRCLPLPKGAHDVRFVYAPSELWTGLWLGGGALAVLLVLLLRAALRAVGVARPLASGA
jgi:hypothetical protein